LFHIEFTFSGSEIKLMLCKLPPALAGGLVQENTVALAKFKRKINHPSNFS